MKQFIIIFLFLCAACVHLSAQGVKPPKYKKCPDDNHPHMIDLALPSGTLWACCNVDAKNPEDAGGYYAWGEITTKSEYTKENYLYKKNKRGTKFQKIGACISGTQYDVAHVKWGGSWQLPTLDQVKELLDNCNEGVWTTQNGVEGRKFTGPNGGSIFLPAAGYRGSSLSKPSGYGYYWSGAQRTSGAYNPYELRFYSDGAYWFDVYRYYGQSVRPVAK